MSVKAYITITGQVQGKFAGDGSDVRNTDRIRIYDYQFGGTMPYDVATGLPTGRMFFESVSIVKEWSAASPQIWTALATNEALTTVLIEFVATSAGGIEEIDHTVTLTHATVARVMDTTENVPPPDGADLRCLDKVEFKSQKVQMHDHSGRDFARGVADPSPAGTVIQPIVVAVQTPH